MVLAVVMIDRVGAGEPRCFDSKHDCSGEDGSSCAGGSGDECYREMAVTRTAVVGQTEADS